LSSWRLVLRRLHSGGGGKHGYGYDCNRGGG